MEGLTLNAATRDILGKKTRFMRRQGLTPTHLFGHNLKSLALQCHTAELQDILAQAGKTTLLNLKIDSEKHPRKVLIREVQKDVFGRQLLHVDFYQVKLTEKIKADIPIVFTGEAPALKLKGRFLMHTLDNLSVECLPDKLPPEIPVDLSPLEEVEQAIHVRDLELDKDITVATDPDQLIVKVSEKVIAEIEEEVVEVEEEEAEEAAAEAPSEEASTEQTGTSA
jgi:large subunit ribosomal protein L25